MVRNLAKVQVERGQCTHLHTSDDDDDGGDDDGDDDDNDVDVDGESSNVISG